MLFEGKIAFRYLLASRLQTSLLLSGVAIGVVVFTFIAALMNGLGVRLTDDVSGNVAHITLEPPARTPQTFMALPEPGRALFAVQPGHDVRSTIGAYRAVVAVSLAVPGVRAAVPEVLGSGTVSRGEKSVAVAVTGVEPREADLIAPLSASMVRGRLDLSAGNVALGSTLASDLGVGVGDRLILRTSQRAAANAAPRQTDTVVTVRGIFTLGVAAVDERVVYLDLSQARKLFAVGDGVSVIELKVHDVWDVQSLAVRLGRATGLEPSNWLDRNTRLEAGLRAQASTGAMIKGFSLLTIAIGVASALYLSVSRRRAEIGILRSFGIGRGQIMRSFMLQGLTVGVCGAATGASLGYGFAVALLGYAANTVGAPSIPIDPARGEYVSAIVLASLASVVASLLPAWSASRIDPLEAIQS